MMDTPNPAADPLTFDAYGGRWCFYCHADAVTDDDGNTTVEHTPDCTRNRLEQLEAASETKTRRIVSDARRIEALERLHEHDTAEANRRIAQLEAALREHEAATIRVDFSETAGPAWGVQRVYPNGRVEQLSCYYHGPLAADYVGRYAAAISDAIRNARPIPDERAFFTPMMREAEPDIDERIKQLAADMDASGFAAAHTIDAWAERIGLERVPWQLDDIDEDEILWRRRRDD